MRVMFTEVFESSQLDKKGSLMVNSILGDAAWCNSKDCLFKLVLCIAHLIPFNCRFTASVNPTLYPELAPIRFLLCILLSSSPYVIFVTVLALIDRLLL